MRKNIVFISLLFLVSNHIVGQNSLNIPVTDCPDPTFSNNTAGWSLFYADDIYNQNAFLSTLPIPPVHYVQGSNATTIITELPTGNRISIATGQELYNNTGVNIGGGPTNLTQFIRIGGEITVGGGSEQVIKKYSLSVNRPILHFFYAAVFNVAAANPNLMQVLPYFKYMVKVQYNDGTYAVLPQYLSGMISPLTAGSHVFNGNKILNSTINIDFSEYVDFCKDPVATLYCMASDGKELTPPPIGYNNDASAYAYISAQCLPKDWVPIVVDNKICVNTIYNLVEPFFSNQSGSEVTYTQWSIGNVSSGATVTLPVGSSYYSFQAPGNYSINYTVHFANGCTNTFSVINEAGECPPPTACDNCTSFDLVLGKKYIISGWVSAMRDLGEENYETLTVYDYDSAKISVDYIDVNGATIGTEVFGTSGEIIDGWQKIYGEILIPTNIDDLKIQLINGYSDGVSVFFDDIRVHPIEGNMKSFAYDQKTQKLMAELDENNYATFYEYDKEGSLIRVKKETEKGVSTIQETRSGTKKVNDNEE